MLFSRKISTSALITIWVICLITIFVVHLHRCGVFILGWERFSILPDTISRKENLGTYAYQVLLPKDLTSLIDKSAYQAVIFEDGIPLPIYYEGSIGRYRVGREGFGNFLLQNRRLFFSATDNSDTRTNEKRYEVGIPRPIDQKLEAYLEAGFILLSLYLGFIMVKAGQLKAFGKVTLLIGVNLFLILGLFACFELFLRHTNGFGNIDSTLTTRRLPYDSNYARNDPTYYRPDEILDESQGFYTWGIQVKMNSLGFREREIRVPKPENTFRVVVLGDSLTFGIGLLPEQRFTDLTENNLKHIMPDKNIEVLNFGEPGADIIDELGNLRRIIYTVQPDLIVIGFCSNDFMANIDLYQVRVKQFESLYGPAVNYIMNGMRKFGFNAMAMVFHRAFNGMLMSLGFLPKIDYSSEILVKEETPEVIAFRENLIEIKNLSDKYELPAPVFVVLNQKSMTSVLTDYEDISEGLPIQLRLYHKAEMIAEESGFKHYNYEKEILEQKPKEISVNEVDDHPSAELNLIYAQKLTSLLLPLIK